MKSIRIHKTGSLDVLQIDEIERPQPLAHEVLIQVHYSTINHMDLWVRQGLPGMGELPLTLGCDASGLVEESGSDVKGFQKGDSVMVYPLLGDVLSPHFQILGEHVNGVHQQYVALPAQNLFKIPNHFSMQEASNTLAPLTAWRMLFTKAQLKKGETVLVVGATSGVGSAAVQFAKAAGAHVVATAGSAAKCEAVLKLGADEAYNHYDDKWSQAVKSKHAKGFDVIFEHVGEAVWNDCLRLLAWHGRLVTCGATSGPMVTLDLRHIFIKQQQILGSTLGTLNDMQAMLDFSNEHKIKPLISDVFEFHQIKEAHQHMHDSKHLGKVLLKWV